jgi:hypothetical protein
VNIALSKKGLLTLQISEFIWFCFTFQTKNNTDNI